MASKKAPVRKLTPPPAAVADDDEIPQEITPQEEKELRRVYDLLCGYALKSRLQKEILPLQDRVLELEDEIATAEAVAQSGDKEGNVLGAVAAFGNATSPAAAGSVATRQMMEAEIIEQKHQELQHLRSDIERKQSQIDSVNSNPDKKVSADDLVEILKVLGRRGAKQEYANQVSRTRREVQDMIWEVDENLDGCVDWEEFQLMYQRNITDKTGLEPSKLYNVVQFMIYDNNMNGSVSVDETMNMLYARYGRKKMEAKLKELFGENMKETGTEGGEITFQEYLNAVETTQMKTFLNSSQGRVQAVKAGRRLLAVAGKH